MASAYAGATFMPPMFGVIADAISIGLYLLYLIMIIFAIFTLVMSKKLNGITASKTHNV